jgi:hypothetical protein
LRIADARYQLYEAEPIVANELRRCRPHTFRRERVADIEDGQQQTRLRVVEPRQADIEVARLKPAVPSR